MKRLNVKFDMDGVLADFISHFKHFMLQRGYIVSVADSFRFNIEPQISPSKISRLIIKASSQWTEVNPMPGARDLITQLYVDTVAPIDIITARAVAIAEPTILLAMKIAMGVPVRVSFASSPDKYRYMDCASVFVEDRRKTAISMARKGFCVLMPDRKYNKITDKNRRMVIERDEWIERRKIDTRFPNGKIILIDRLTDLHLAPFYDLLIRKEP